MKTREQVQMLSSVVSFCGVSVWCGAGRWQEGKAARPPYLVSLCDFLSWVGWGRFSPGGSLSGTSGGAAAGCVQAAAVGQERASRAHGPILPASRGQQTVDCGKGGASAQ